MKMEKIITWLQASSIQFYSDQNDKIMKRLTGTGGWILEHTSYTQWKNKPTSQVLWVKGKRGCGKSILASVVVQEIKTFCERPQNLKCPNNEKTAFAYIYCNSLDANTIDPSKFLSSIIEQLCYQLVNSATDNYLEYIYDRHGGNRSIDMAEIREALDSLLGRFNESFIVVDGLDELRGLSHDQFEGLCRFFRKLTGPRSDGAVVKLVAFSRPEYAAISNEFDGCPSITIDSGANEKDIEKFITMRLSSTLLHLKQNPEPLKDIGRDLLSRAEGMFLWG